MKKFVLAILMVLVLATPVVADGAGSKLIARLCSDLNDIGYLSDSLTTEEIQEIIYAAIIYAQSGDPHFKDAVNRILDSRPHTTVYKSVVLGYALGVNAYIRIALDEHRLEEQQYGNK